MRAGAPHESLFVKWILGIVATLLVAGIARGFVVVGDVAELKLRREYDVEWQQRFERKLDAIAQHLDVDPELLVDRP